MTNPFVFMTSIQSVQLTGVSARNLAELHEGIRKVDDSSIYHHTYRFLRMLHFLPDTTHSDFAFWAGENLKEIALGERIMALDLRSFTDLAALRRALLSLIGEYQNNPRQWERSVPAGLEFHFCSSTSIILPSGFEARDLESFVEGLGRVDVGSLFYHLVEYPLHQDGNREFRNDISEWLARELGLAEEAGIIARLDPYNWDMETLRGKTIELLGRGRLRTLVETVLSRQSESETTAVVRSLLQKWRGSKTT